MADHLMDSRKIIRQIHDELAVNFILAEHSVARRMARIAALNQFIEDILAPSLPVQCDAVARRLACEFAIAQDLRAQSARYATSRMFKILPENKIRDDCVLHISVFPFNYFLELPHDIIFTTRNARKPPSRRRPSDIPSLKIHFLPTTF